jgi:hypothetical protein
MTYFVIGIMAGAFLIIGYKYFTEQGNCSQCSGSCEQGRKECDCE